MTQIPPTEPQEESLGSLVAAASDQISTLVRAEIELAKAELKFDAKRVGVAGGLFGAAAFMAHLCLILLSFAIAYALIGVGIWRWAAFLIVTGLYLVTAGLLAFIGMRRLKGMTKMKGTLRSLKTIKSGEPELGSAPPATAGQIGTHREPVRPGQ
ncbi:phage holin family protein [Streptosporangium lutulentum]|uniref:Membrane protein YqjE n=1 Tax=Streptosporangium lutulentum TaxID=1461250 RepID=A0ABT9QLY1_9ACTN|nr:phage holin family protein [Streptosporangium lutulentum]MDP9847385.1 putative membrane protein YqjE [Streptosporangium lutulentum]